MKAKEDTEARAVQYRAECEIVFILFKLERWRDWVYPVGHLDNQLGQEQGHM